MMMMKMVSQSKNLRSLIYAAAATATSIHIFITYRRIYSSNYIQFNIHIHKPHPLERHSSIAMHKYMHYLCHTTNTNTTTKANREILTITNIAITIINSYILFVSAIIMCMKKKDEEKKTI